MFFTWDECSVLFALLSLYYFVLEADMILSWWEYVINYTRICFCCCFPEFEYFCMHPSTCAEQFWKLLVTRLYLLYGLLKLKNAIFCRLRSSLWLQFKPHHIAAGAAYLAAKFLNMDLAAYQIIWHEFQTTPSILQGTPYTWHFTLLSSNSFELLCWDWWLIHWKTQSCRLKL